MTSDPVMPMPAVSETKDADAKALLATSIVVGLAAWCSLGTIGFSGAARIGILPAWWLLPILIVAAWALGRTLRLSLSQIRPFWAAAIVLLPWLPVPVPAAFLLWTGVLTVPVWMLTLVGAVLARPHSTVSWWRTGWSPIVAAAVALALYGVSARQLAPLMPDGDAPHYLIIAQSLVTDGDLKIENNHRRGDYLQYSLHASQPDFLRRGVNGEIYSIHAPGLPAIIAPAMWALGYPGVVAVLGVLAALSTGLVWWVSYSLTRDAPAAWFAWAASALTVPFFFQATEVFPDGLAAGLLLVGTLPLLTPRAGDLEHVPHVDSMRDRDGQTYSDRLSTADSRLWLVSGAALALLPWLQTRLAILAVTAAACLVLRLKSVKQLVAFAILPAVSAAGWFAFFYRVYGTFNPAAPYGTYTQTAVANLWRGLPGILFDQQFGLLTHAPVYGAIFMGLVWAAANRQRWSAELLALVLPYTIGVAMYEHWWGGASVAARFLTPLTLVLAVGGARVWRETAAGTRSVYLAALSMSVLITAVLLLPAEGRLLVNFRDGIALWLEFASQNLALPRGVPSLFADDPSRAALKAGVWALSSIAAWLVIRRRTEGENGLRMSGATIAALCVVPMVALTVIWSMDGAGALTPARGELALVRQVQTHAGSMVVDLTARRLVSSPDLADALRVRADDLRPRANPTVLLTARRVPAGRYALQATPITSADVADGVGRLTLRIGDTRVPFASLPVPRGGQVEDIEWPVDVESIVVEGDPAALRAISRVELQPLAGIVNDAPRSAARDLADPSDDRVATLLAVAGPPARRAARYTNGVVFFRDDNAFPETDGFWVAGGRRADVVVDRSAAGQRGEAVSLLLRNAHVANHVSIAVDDKVVELQLESGEERRLDLPAPRRPGAVSLQITSDAGFRPSAVEPGNQDFRFLGCWVELAAE